MPRGRIETKITVIDTNTLGNVLAGVARYCGYLTITKADGDPELTEGMPIVYVSTLVPTGGRNTISINSKTAPPDCFVRRYSEIFHHPKN
jgi:hypothetical protein